MHDLHDITTHFEGTGGHYFADSDTSIGLRVSQALRSSKVALFLLTMNGQIDDRQNRLHYPLHMRAG